MSEGTTDPEDLDDPSSSLEPTPKTGVAELDEVIAAVAALDDQRVEDHVGTLESAHQVLRQALDQPRNPD